jgi:hypothetical protein
LSRKHRSLHTRRPEFPWAIIAAGGLLLALAGFLFVRQATPEETGNPQVAVDQQKIDYGYVKFGETRQFKIAVTNTGDGVLRFEKKPYVEVVEGC